MRDRTKKFSYAASAGSRGLGEFFKKFKDEKKGEEISNPVKRLGQVTLDSFKRLKKKIRD